MIKFPSTSDGGFVPSGNSLAVTYPGVRGSRAGGVGRAGRVADGAWDAAAAIAGATAARRVTKNTALKIFAVIVVSLQGFMPPRAASRSAAARCAGAA